MELITLENGLRLITHKRDDLRSATLGIWVASGSRNETEENNGISHFIEHIVFKGSKKRSAFEIAEGMDRIGASVNAYTTKEYTFFYTRALDYQILSAADILFDMIKNPRLDENDIETEKGVIAEEIAMCEDDPSDVCFELNENVIFEGDPLSLQILGSKESIYSFRKENFKNHIKRYYVPERTVIGISGNFDEAAMLEKIKEYFSADANTGNPIENKKVPFKPAFTLKKRGFEQTHIAISFDGVGIEHEDLYAIQVCLFILGTGSSSRLNQRIREQLGLVYDISAWMGRYLGGGYIAISMSLSPDSEEAALRETCEIIRNLASSITEAELATAKEKLIASLIMSREQPQSQLSSFGYTQLMLSKFIDDDSIINGIRAITLEQTKATAEK
ncbi:MAG: insulinase family protein, partial [Ruminococcus sp.]|nr:insulinase family protein [Ruminococcus sp.]